jgi:hypothetical protein
MEEAGLPLEIPICIESLRLSAEAVPVGKSQGAHKFGFDLLLRRCQGWEEGKEDD